MLHNQSCNSKVDAVKERCNGSMELMKGGCMGKPEAKRAAGAPIQASKDQA